MIRYILLSTCLLIHSDCLLAAQSLRVKPGREAIVKEAPTGNAPVIPPRLPAGTVVEKLGEAERYYSIRLSSGAVGWSYKGNFEVLSTPISTPAVVTKESLLARTDLLQIIILDVEVGDATLIICPRENDRQDVILIDTGVNDSDRIFKELTDHGFSLTTKPLTRFIATHYDDDHIGDAEKIVPLAQIVYDHGNNNSDSWYRDLFTEHVVERHEMELTYDEQFSGGVRIQCVAVNQATDFDPDVPPHNNDDNSNSIALIISHGEFDYFTGGDLTLKPERSLAQGIKNCDVYHVNHHGSLATSSETNFVTRLDPEVSIASNGRQYGHPHRTVAERLKSIGSDFYQTNINLDERAYNAGPKWIADDTLNDSDNENAEGALGTIRLVVDPATDNFYVLMNGLELAEATYPIEH